MTVKINGSDVSRYITSIDKRRSCRGESTSYSLDGTAYTDRFGGFKASFSITFGIVPISAWHNYINLMSGTSFTINYDNTDYTVHLKGDISEPYGYNDPKYGYCIKDASLEVEEI